ncbi:MAG: hypothetical protein ABW172_14240 [Candidatus Binatia bacterium]
MVRRLVDGGFVAEQRRTEAQEMIKHDLYAMLRDLASLPSQVADPDWMKKIDSDLRDQVKDEEVAGGGFVPDPSSARRRTEQAERRRAQKTAVMRKLRVEGRA